ncbi:MAG: YidC/Oxa1 family membrane protein insertase [Treponema sp.]
MSKILTGLLYPFVVLIQTVFTYSYTICGNYGAALILLSLFITGITAPLYYLAEKWKNTERLVQKKMHKDIKSITSVYEGQKRFYLIKTARKIYGYKWWYTVRTSFGLIIQIPFFFAAYEVLANYTGYQGISFLFIKDLAQPDRLIAGVNALPFVMTAVNIAYSIYYTKSKSWQANKELYSMAVLFLVLLYNSPSALLLYWTMNNVFSFIKGILLRKAGLSQIPVQIESEASKPIAVVLKDHIGLIHFFFFTLCCSLQVYSLVQNSVRHKYVLFLMIGAAVFSTIAVLVFHHTRKNSRILLVTWIGYLPLLYLLFFTLRTNAYISPDNIKLLTGFYAALITTISVRLFFSVQIAHIEYTSLRGSISVIGCIVFWLFFYLPLLFYINNPSIITEEIGSYLFRLFLPAGGVFLGFIGIYYILPPILKQYYEVSAVLFLFVVLTYSLLLKLNIGELDFFMLKNADVIFSMKLLYYVLDACILSGLLLVARFVVLKYRKVLVFFSICVPLTLSALLMHRYQTAPQRQEPISVQNAAEPKPAQEVYNNYIFSKNKNNVVCILVDMFNGNYLGRILEENPAYKQKLSGFTWYADCLSVSISTTRSLAGLLGGHAYAEKAAGMMDYTEINAEASSSFFENLFTSGYDMSVDTGSDYAGVDMSQYHTMAYTGVTEYWKHKNGYKEEKTAFNTATSLVLIMLAVLQSAPYHLKYIIYDDENWLFFHKSGKLAGSRDAAMHRVASLDILPEVSSAMNTEQKKCMYIHSMLPHYPYAVNKNGKIMQDDEFGSFSYAAFNNKDLAVYSAKLTVDCLLRWFDWMKKEDVYDNTVIYIFADHGNIFYDSDIPLPAALPYKNAEKNLSAANSLLLIKPLHSNGEFVQSPLYISSADLHSMLVTDAGLHTIADKDPRTMTAAENQQRTRMFFGPDTYFLKNDRYYVTGSMFAPESWSVQTPAADREIP